MTLLFIITDLLSVFSAYLIAYLLRIRSGIFTHSTIPFSLYLNLTLLTMILTLLIFFHFHHYRYRRGFFSPEEFFFLFRSYLMVFIAVMAITFLIKGFIFSRIIILFAFAFSVIFTSAFRYLYRRFAPKSPKRVLIVGNTSQVKFLEQKIKNSPELHYQIVSTIRDLHSFDRYSQKVDIVFIAMNHRPSDLLDIVERNEHITFKIVSDYIDLLTEPINFDEFSDIPLIELKDKSSSRLYFIFKRILDIILSSLLFIILLPLLSFVALLIKLNSSGPIIICQTRTGYRERPFTFYKFRTMYNSSQPNTKLQNEVDYLFKKKLDPRVTPIGKILRRYCLDELPQLYNVLKGDMSLVGPRPHFAHELQHLQNFQRKRFLVLPGMTGLWQISGRHNLSFDRTIYLDIYYVKHLSLLLDIEILLKTIPAILFSRGFW